ncbi:hypothetical protein QE152_g10926 [Popillia japonica]|uniref:Uncharacterized protein n=1 Tax=Popillia japonica TaxID=7064 RepID=A0AAW1LS67_POPJA
MSAKCSKCKAGHVQRPFGEQIPTNAKADIASSPMTNPDLLQVTDFDFEEKVKMLRLICDGCGSQHKNTTMVGMLNYWLQYEAPLNIELVGMDRVFGQIEKRYKKVPEVVHPEEYIDIIKEFAKVYKIGNDVVVKDGEVKLKSLCKRGKNISQSPQPLQHGVPTNDKKRSITKLLEKHYGKEWQKEDSLVFFKEAFQTVVEGQ